jgi:selenide,water dikinase
MGFHSNDDASVVQLREDLVVVQSLDFFMPIVDDPYTFGMIAAANSISDIYAMGATPISALSILGLPIKKIPPEVANQIMQGGAEICRRAGIPILGGHSIDDTEPKFGLSVTGVAHPDDILYNSTAQDGDVLVLTKPLGIGALGQGNKKKVLTESQIADFVKITTFLNDAPMRAAKKVGVSAATDVTGFGLLGHAWEMAKGCGVGVEIFADQLPVVDGVWALLESGIKPGATGRNLSYLEPNLDVDSNVTEIQKLLAADPQTSGGLLLSVHPNNLEALLESLEEEGALCAVVVGRFRTTDSVRVRLRRSSE